MWVYFVVAANDILSLVVTHFSLRLTKASIISISYINQCTIRSLVNVGISGNSLLTIRNIIQEQQHVTLILNCTAQQL